MPRVQRRRIYASSDSFVKLPPSKPPLSLIRTDGRTVRATFRSDSGAVRRLELSSLFRTPLYWVKIDAQRREEIFFREISTCLTPIPFNEARSSVSQRRRTKQNLSDLRVSERLAYVGVDFIKRYCVHPVTVRRVRRGTCQSGLSGTG